MLENEETSRLQLPPHTKITSCWQELLNTNLWTLFYEHMNVEMVT